MLDVLRRKALCAIHTAQITKRKQPDCAASRAYYAVFNAVRASLGPQGLRIKHGECFRRSVLDQVGLDGHDAQAISTLYHFRRQGDYDESRSVSADEALSCYSDASAILVKLGMPHSA